VFDNHNPVLAAYVREVQVGIVKKIREFEALRMALAASQIAPATTSAIEKAMHVMPIKHPARVLKQITKKTDGNKTS
jgi:hypothetical protein